MMASIVLSFVGSQDPASESTNQEGSIVTLIRHLLQIKCQIRKVLLLYTEDKKENAILTQEWLKEEVEIEQEKVELIAVSSTLSDDPIDVQLATKEAYQGFQKALKYRSNHDIFEFNSSSGTPSMKTAWGILQASGYGKDTRLWQVRNPKTMKASQALVFENNVNIFKNESDLKVIKKQLLNYNYQGALQTLQSSEFEDPISLSLLQYASGRLSFNFDEAFAAINYLASNYQGKWLRDINQLRQKKATTILSEVYYKAEVKLEQKQYADFLILLFTFQENLLRYLVKKTLFPPNQINKNWKSLGIEEAVKKHDNGKLWTYLQDYRLPNGGSLRLDLKSVNRIMLRAIIDYDSSPILRAIDYLESYCNKRNDYIHNLEGVSAISDDEQKEIKKQLQQILESITNFSTINPFNSLNEAILNQLTPIIRG